jgi:hypothetical protein
MATRLRQLQTEKYIQVVRGEVMKMTKNHYGPNSSLPVHTAMSKVITFD